MKYQWLVVALAMFHNKYEVCSAALLIYLASTRRPQAREVLAELLWDERSQSQVLGYLRVALHALRKTLGGSLILGRESLALNPSVLVWLDTIQLEDCSKVVHQQGKVTAVTAGQVAGALELYRGICWKACMCPPLPGLPVRLVEQSSLFPEKTFEKRFSTSRPRQN